MKNAPTVFSRSVLSWDKFNHFGRIAPDDSPCRNIFVTTAPDAMTASSPTVTPGFKMAPPPIHTRCPTVTGFPYSSPEIRSVGFERMRRRIHVDTRTEHTIVTKRDWTDI